VTQQDAIRHWQEGAKKSLHAAEVLYGERDYESALFHCHLAVEKALKALYMEQRGEDHPHTHDLAYLASLIQHNLSKNDEEELKVLTSFVTDARYSDPYWAAEQANAKEAARWIASAKHLLSSLLPS